MDIPATTLTVALGENIDRSALYPCTLALFHAFGTQATLRLDVRFEVFGVVIVIQFLSRFDVLERKNVDASIL